MPKQNIYPLRIHVEDTDFTGLVFHPHYLNFMERARSEWLRSEGFGIEWQKKHHISFVVHSVTMQFIKPAKLHHLVEVVSSVKKIGAASLVLEQYLREASEHSTILCKAEIKLACVNNDFKPSPMPEITQLRRIIA